VDGRPAAVVDLNAEAPRDGVLVWTRNWLRSGKHVVVVAPVDPTQRVEIDGFFVVR